MAPAGKRVQAPRPADKVKDVRNELLVAVSTQTVAKPEATAMPQYLCSLPNEKKAGRIPQLITDDPEKIAAFIKRWDIPGRGVFRCINPLRPGATSRSIENIE